MDLHRLVALALVLALLGCSKDRPITTQSVQALKFYTNGLSQWEKFYYVEALRAFDEAIRLDSNFAMAWARRAVLNDRMQNNAKARTEIVRAMALTPFVLPYERMFIRLESYRLNFLNTQAKELVDSMVLLYPQEKEVHLIRGNLFEFSKRFDDAIRSYSRAIEIDTGYALAVMSLGYAYSSIGDQERSVAQMQRYIRLAPDAADPRASFGDILNRVGRYEEALEQYKKSLVLKPDYWYSAYQIGLIYTLQGRLKAAEEQFHKGLRSLPESDQLKGTHLALDGNLNMLRGEYRESVRLCRAALELDSLNGEAAYGLVNAFRKVRDFKRAHEVLTRIRTVLESRHLLPSQYLLRYNLVKSKLLLDQDEYEAARALCDSALEFTTALSRGPVFQQIAEIDLREQQYENAFDACEEALRINPNHPEPLFTLVKAYHAKGDAAMAKEIGERLLEFWGDADPDFLNLKELQQILGIKKRIPIPTSSSSALIGAETE